MNQTHVGSLTLFLDEVSVPAGRVRVIFTTRRGGISQVPYSGLNLSFDVGDEERAVSANWLQLRRALDLGTIASVDQVHGSNVVDLRNKPDHRSETSRVQADGMVIGPGMAAAVLTADCLPIILVDEAGSAAAVIHAGWRGTLAEIVKEGVGRLVGRTGGSPGSVRAFLGPAIYACCYQVGAELKRVFANKFSEADTPGLSLDLTAINTGQLQRAGISSDRIYTVGRCTHQEDLFFSYRRQPMTGRMAAIAAVEEDSEKGDGR